MNVTVQPAATTTMISAPVQRAEFGQEEVISASVAATASAGAPPADRLG